MTLARAPDSIATHMVGPSESRVEGPGAGQRSGTKRRRINKPDADIILLCNPRAGGRWRELAEILDSEEARFVRRIVTDSVEDIAPALSDLGHEAKLLCIYGGDGTIQRIIDRMAPYGRDDIQLALLGGGTMNVTSHWCGLTGSPAQSFRSIVQAYRTGNLLLKEVPLLEVQHGDEVHRGFTVGMGPIVRILDAYERGRKGKAAALGIALQSVLAAWIGRPAAVDKLIAPMEAEVRLDGEVLPYQRFSAVFGNVTGQINLGVEPFVDVRNRDEFYCAAYAVKPRELALNLPMLIRGWLPIDRASLLRPMAILKRLAETSPDRLLSLPTNPRYVNRPVTQLEIHSEESLYTVDGEIFASGDSPLTVKLGPTIRLAVSPTAGLGSMVRMAVSKATPG